MTISAYRLNLGNKQTAYYFTVQIGFTDAEIHTVKNPPSEEGGFVLTP